MASKITARHIVAVGAKQLSHIMLGKQRVQPAEIADRPQDQFERVMARLRLKEPMPVAMDELLAWLLPQYFLQLDTRVARASITEQDKNALGLMEANRDDAIHHVRFDNTQYADVFWIRTHVLHSVYMDANAIDMVLPSGSITDQLKEWASKAKAVERDIEECSLAIDRLCRATPNPRVAYARWPQLQSILRLPISSAGKYAKGDRTERELAAISEEQRERITRLYATCLMLPEGKPIAAWVGRYYGFGEA